MKYKITIFLRKDCGTGAGGFQPGNDCSSGGGSGVGSGITIPNNGVNENVNTSSWPLASSKVVVNMNNPSYKNLLRELAVNEKQQIMPKLDEMMGVATSDKFKTTESKKVFFGLSDFVPKKDSDSIQSLGTRSVTSDLERARRYAGNNGSVYEVTIPIGTRLVDSKVLGIKESVLLPGSKFKIGKKTNGITKLTLQDDGSSFVKEVFNFQKELDKIYEENNNKK